MKRFRMYTGDITTSQTDAIVNAANSSLLGGGGVDGAIHRAGGPQILKECRAIRSSGPYQKGLPPGEAVVTSGGNLSAQWIIHTVGPIWHDGTIGEEDILASAIRNSLALATNHDPQIRTVAFPAVSTGVYGYPKDQAYRVIHREITAWLDAHDLPERVDLVLFSEADAQKFRSLFPSVSD